MIRRLLATIALTLGVLAGSLAAPVSPADAAIPPVRYNWSAARYLKGTNCLIRVRQSASRNLIIRAENASCILIRVTLYSYPRNGAIQQRTREMTSAPNTWFIWQGRTLTVWLDWQYDACQAWIRGLDRVRHYGDLAWARSSHSLF